MLVSRRRVDRITTLLPRLLAAVFLCVCAGLAQAQITFRNAPADISLPCQFLPPVATVTARGPCPGPETVSFAEARVDGSCANSYELHRTWTATDNCGGRAEYTQIVTLTDTRAPFIPNFPGNVTVFPDSIPPVPTLTAFDLCDGAPTISMTRDSVPGPCGGYSLIHNFVATDACGNTSQRQWLVFVSDDIRPQLVGVTPGGELACGDSLPPAPLVTAIDNGAVPPTVSMRLEYLPAGGDTCQVIERVWTATDECNLSVEARQRFWFIDGQAPVLFGIPADTIIYCEALPPIPEAYTAITATDNCDTAPMITYSEVSTQTINQGLCSDVIYEVRRTWTALDECGNQTSATQIVEMLCECCYNGIDDDNDGLADDYDPQCNCFSGVTAECDSSKVYYIPPVLQPIRETYRNPSELVITTLAPVANVNIRTGDGTTYNQNFTVAKGTPLRINLTIDQLQTANINTPESNSGWIITSDALIQPIYRIDGQFNKVLVTVKGPQALGRVFRAGSQTNLCNNNDMVRGEGHFISVMATEPNTTVNFKLTFPALGLTGSDHTVVLQRYETYLIRDDASNTTVSGSLITSDKAIVVNSGSQHTRACVLGTNNLISGQDGGIDQLVPNCLTGDEYVVVRGKGRVEQQYAIVVANKNNTRITINGDPNTEFVLNAGEHRQTFLVGADYSPFHFQGNKPFYMYHVSGISTNNEVGMAIAAPIGECKGDTLIEFPKFEGDPNGNFVDNSVYVIMQKADLASLTINGTAYSTCASARDVPNRPDLSMVVFEAGCINQYNSIKADGRFTAGMLVGISGSTGTHGYLTSFKDRMSVFKPGTQIQSTAYLVDTLCGAQTVTHCVDVTSCATSHYIAAVRQGAGRARILNGGTCFEYTSPTQFQGVDEVLVTVQNDLGLFQTVCVSYYICAEPPEIEFPFTDTTVTCESVPPLSDPILSDECDMRIEFAVEDSLQDGSCDYAYTIYRHWDVWDDCGDSTRATQIIRVVDTTAPQFLDIPSDTIVYDCAGIPPVPTPTFTENCDGAYNWTFKQETVDSLCPYDYTIVRTWESWDGCGNNSTAVQRIKVQDDEPPKITISPPGLQLRCGDSPTMPFVQITDNCDPNVTMTYDSIVHASGCDTIRHVERLWTATDACGRTATANQHVVTRDLDAPVAGNIPPDVQIACGAPLPTDAPIWGDYCTSPVTVTQSDSSAAGACPVIETIYRTWVASDLCGNVASARQVIEIVDFSPPIITALADTVFGACSDSIVIQEPTITDDCGFTVTRSDSIFSKTCVTERYIWRTYVATDPCGNSAEYTQLYFFRDTVAPVWTNQPLDTVLVCGDTIPEIVDPNIVDACSGINPIDVVVRDSFSTCPARRYIFRTYTTSDFCGNLGVYTHRIVVEGCEPTVPRLSSTDADCTGEDIVLRATVDTFYRTPVFGWEYSADSLTWTALPHPTDSATYTIPAATPAASGFYRIVVSDAAASLSDTSCSTRSAAIELNVNPTKASTEQIDLCRGDTLYYLGDTLTQSVIRTDTLQTSLGCDSVATLELTVFPFVEQVLDTTLCFGESLTVFGTTYTSSAVYRDTLVTAYGCDTTLELRLTVLPDLRDTLRDILCEGEDYTFEGTTYTLPGTYAAPFVGYLGCDSTRTLVLTQNDTARARLYAVICPGETFVAAGESFTAAGTYTRVLPSANGCDSVLTLRLRVTDTSAVRSDRLLCQGDDFRWGSHFVNRAGTYRRTLTTAHGCDSNEVMYVTTAAVQNTELREELCAGEVYTNGSYSFNAPGRWRMDFNTYQGCDSTVYVTLVYRPPFDQALSETICVGDSYQLMDTVLTTAGTFRRSGSSEFGCDSTVTLTLSLKQQSETHVRDSLCFGESLTVGPRTYTTSILDTVVVSDVLGCDSTVFVDLTVLDDPDTDTAAVICFGDSFPVGGVARTTTGVYRDTSTTDFGCEAIHTVYLTVVPEKRDTLRESVCMGDTLAYAGEDYYATGSYPRVFASVSGCDSTMVLQLTVFDTGYTEVYEEVCTGTTYTHAGLNFDTPGEYKIDLTTRDGCDSTVVLTLTHRDPTYELITERLCFGETIEFGGVVRSARGMYTLDLKNTTGCDSTVVLELEYFEEALLRDTIEICDGDGRTLGGAYRTTSGVYTSSYTNEHGCDSTRLTTLNVHGNSHAQDTVYVCPGDTYFFEGREVTESGTQSAEYTTVWGCDSTIIVEVVLVQEIKLAVDDVEVCLGTTTQLYARGYDGPVRWEPTTGLSCTVCPAPFVDIDATTRYTAIAVGCDGVETRDTATVTIKPTVAVEIEGKDRLRLGERSVLRAVADNPAAELNWTEGGELICSDCDEVTVQPEEDEMYEVEAILEEGCGDVAQLQIRVEDACVLRSLQIPNLLTPNGDGANDEFEIRYEGLAEVSLMRIFNRWGEVVFETERLDEFWDGTFRGKPVNPGVYVYYLEGKCLNEEPFVEQGNVTVVR